MTCTTMTPIASHNSRPLEPFLGRTSEMFATTTSVALRPPAARRTRPRGAPAAARASARVAVDKKSAKKNVITFLAATAVATGVLTLDNAALANDHYANDCDPICHVLDDGAAKSQKQEEEMKKAGPDMGSLMEQLQAQRKAEEAAARAAKK